MAKGKWAFGASYIRSGVNGNRVAGDGIISDDYSEDSGNKCLEMRRPKVRFPMDKRDPTSLNGPVIIVQEGKKKNA